MAFWSDATQQDPKRQYRWILRVASIPAYVLKKADKPSFTVSETEHKYLNHTYYYPGRVQWQEINVTLADPINPDMAATITNIIKDGGYLPAQNTDDDGHATKQFAKSLSQGPTCARHVPLPVLSHHTN